MVAAVPVWAGDIIPEHTCNLSIGQILSNGKISTAARDFARGPAARCQLASSLGAASQPSLDGRNAIRGGEADWMSSGGRVVPVLASPCVGRDCFQPGVILIEVFRQHRHPLAC